MKVLMLSSESVPFSKSGGLADVVGDLSARLSLLSCDVRVMIPAYHMSPSEAGEEAASVQIRLLGGFRQVDIRQKKLGKVTFYFVCDSLFCNRRGIYGDTSFTPYPDNFLRFLILSKAALAFCSQAGWIPDVFHCHDWTSGLLPFLIKRDRTGIFKHSKTLFTIHNLAYQGVFPKIEFLNAMEETDRDLMDGENINMMRCGLIYSDWISTVSPTYAIEIQGHEQGCGLEDILERRSAELSGILNGIDTAAWNPENDPLLSSHFGQGNMEGKALIKSQVQIKFRLPQNPDAPLFVMISRLAWQKGIEELLEALPQLLSDGKLQFLIIGTGDSKYEDQLRSLELKHPNLSANMIFSNEAAHMGEAAGDFFLMPSHYEPCGLNQMYSLRYGDIPIAHRTGGLADSITDLFSNPEKGNGILMDSVNPQSIIDSVRKASGIYHSPEFFTARENAMKCDFSWDSSAKKYISLYRQITKKGGKHA
ncbi:MAG: glycogen/starch synthase [Sphaerochaetaceae bacterium]